MTNPNTTPSTDAPHIIYEEMHSLAPSEESRKAMNDRARTARKYPKALTYENVPLTDTPHALTATQAAERTGHTPAYFRNIMSKLNSGGRDLRTPPTPGARARTYDLDKLDAWIAEGMPLPQHPNTIPKPKPNAHTIHATATHNGNTWTITMEEIGLATPAENLHTGQRTAHALAVQKTGLNPDEITIKTTYKLPTNAADQWAQAKTKEAEAKEATALAAKLSRQVVLDLQAQGCSYPDIGEMLGISYQRAQQIAKSAAKHEN